MMWLYCSSGAGGGPPKFPAGRGGGEREYSLTLFLWLKHTDLQHRSRQICLFRGIPPLDKRMRQLLQEANGPRSFDRNREDSAACCQRRGGKTSSVGCGSKNRNSKMACPGKWKHGPKPAVCPSCFILSHTLFATREGGRPSFNFADSWVPPAPSLLPGRVAQVESRPGPPFSMNDDMFSKLCPGACFCVQEISAFPCYVPLDTPQAGGQAHWGEFQTSHSHRQITQPRKVQKAPLNWDNHSSGFIDPRLSLLPFAEINIVYLPLLVLKGIYHYMLVGLGGEKANGGLALYFLQSRRQGRSGLQ